MATNSFNREDNLEILSGFLKVASFIIGIALLFTIGFVKKYSFSSDLEMSWIGVGVSIFVTLFMYAIALLFDVIAEISRTLKK